ncbi:hypothetical protein GC1_00031 [Gluconobacter phage GC1]|uniref:Uncharacterized protein n=1 Tax=Gluconobacter phage GC1 TaxID=2047788 RepID=A0A2I5AR98_9VIRU|nr:hypothetical protein FDJ08_gp31 [Gluconobacter phage GC1]ATS92599.1 hypothetical protein GC1_00031 [Gluconobacter phage GC1]
MISEISKDFVRRMGKRARISGLPISACVYVHGSECAKLWEDGWNTADYELRSAKRRH